MRVALAGAGCVAERCVAPTLLGAGHEVVRLWPPDRGEAPAALVADWEQAMRGCDALVNLSPRKEGGGVSGSEAVRGLLSAARAAGVRRVVQQSVSLMYADQGQEWITERSPLCVTVMTEPASMAEVAVQDFTSPCREGVVLRMGIVVGDVPLTRWCLRAVTSGRRALDDSFTHVIHSHDVGPAVSAALTAPSGIYNVGAAPVRRSDLVQGCAQALGRAALVARAPRWLSRHLEPGSRSLRVSSSSFAQTTGFSPRWDTFDPAWFDVVGPRHLAVR